MKFDEYIGKGFHRWNEGVYTPGQLQAWHDYKSTYILLSGAYRSGKTEIGCRAAIRHAYFFPDAKVGIFRKFLASIKKSTLLTLLELINPSWVADWSNSELVLTLKNRSKISFFGIDQPDKVGSIELTFAFSDEASEIPRESLGMITGRLSGQLLLPSNFYSLPENKQQYIIQTKDVRQHFMACNPKSDNHHLYQDFFKQPKPRHTAYTSNSISNTNLPETYIVNNLSAYIRPGYDEAWVKEQIRLIRVGDKPSDGLHLTDALTPFGQRNLLGLWVALEGAIYQLDEKYHYVDKKPDNFGFDQSYYGCVDYGFHNPRIIIVKHFYQVKEGLKIEDDEKIDSYLCVDFWHEGNGDYDDIIKQIKQFTHTYNIKTWYLPPDQPGINKTVKNSIGLNRVKIAKNSVNAGINTVSRFLNLRRLAILKTDKSDLCWSEMSGYSWQQHREGFSLESPLKVADHYCDAIRYLLFTRHGKDGI